jgi:hypothetical protein
MRKILIISHLIIIISNSLIFSQNLYELQYKLSQTEINNYDKVIKITDEIFKIDKYNEYAIYYLTQCYTYNESKNLIDTIFKNFCKKDSLNPTIYLLKAKYADDEISLIDTNIIIDLRKAYNLNGDDYETCFILGNSYYSLFNQQYNKSLNLDTFKLQFYANQCNKFLNLALLIKPQRIDIIKYPIIQTCNYLQQNDKIKIIEEQCELFFKNDFSNPKDSNFYYFPIFYFADFSYDWQNKYLYNINREVDLSEFVINWYSNQLHALKEPVIFNNGTSKEIYRFTWLRTFHEPISIRLEKENDIINLYIKGCSGAGGYSPGVLKINKIKQIQKNDFETFIGLLDTISFWEMPSNEKNYGCDGAVWLLEGYKDSNYQIVNRWSPNKNDSFREACFYLLNLSEIDIKKSEIY